MHDLGPPFPNELFSRQAREFIAKHLEMSILHLAEDQRLTDAGFGTAARAKRSVEVRSAEIEEADYEAIDLNDLRAKTMPLQFMSRAILLQAEDRARLLEIPAAKNPFLASTSSQLIDVMEQTGYFSRTEAVRAMVVCHNLLWMLDTCIVIDDVELLVSGSQARSFAHGTRNSTEDS